MNLSGSPELIEQAIVMRMALEALSVTMTILLCLTLVAFAVYLASVFYLCLLEIRPAKTLRQTSRSHRPAMPVNNECAISHQPDSGADSRADGRATVSWAEAK